MKRDLKDTTFILPIKIESDEHKQFNVINPRDGGQSKIIKSYLH